MKITHVEVFGLHIPMIGAYRQAIGDYGSMRSVAARIATDSGIVGVGDAHESVAGYTPESLETMQAIITHSYGPALIGRELEPQEALHRHLTSVRKGNPFARCVLEIAMFDALARARGINIAALLGGPSRQKLGLVGGVGIEEPEVAAEKTSAFVKAGFGTVKVKIGTSNVRRDIERVRAVRAAVGDGINLRVDANAAYTLPDAMIVTRAMADLGVEHFEQPVPAGDHVAMARLRQLGAAPIMADESAETPQDAYRLITAGAVDAIKIKITKVGGYINARKIIDLCEAAGIKVVVGSGISTTVEAAAEAHLACAFSHVCPIAEMVGPAKLKGDIVMDPWDLSSGELVLPEGLGLGVELSDEALRRFSESVSTDVRAA